MKVKLGYGVDDDIACMNAIGKAIQGKPIKLMIDTNHAYGRAEALRPAPRQRGSSEALAAASTACARVSTGAATAAIKGSIAVNIHGL